jgi:DNA-binding NarL/FixJ family response regulator
MTIKDEGMHKARIVLFGKHSIANSCLEQLLWQGDSIQFDGRLDEGAFLQSALEDIDLDVVLVDHGSFVNTLSIDFPRYLQRIQSRSGACMPSILCFNVPLNYFEIKSLANLGIHNCLEEAASYKGLCAAINCLARKRKFLSNTVAQCVAQFELGHSQREVAQALRLPQRELQVCQAISRGESVAQLAKQLCVSPKSVQTYRYRVFRKLKINSDVQLTLLWQKLSGLGLTPNVE